MWKSQTFCVYDWSDWEDFVIDLIWPKARRIQAKFQEAPTEIVARLPRKAKLLLLHLDISDASPFIPDARAFFRVLSERSVRVLNCLTPDIRKRTIQSCCRDFGLPSVTASTDGPDGELLIVKTDLNYAGERERLLSAEQRNQFNLTVHPGSIKSPPDYFVCRRAQVAADIWKDSTLVVERYVKNPLGRFFRVYFAVDAVVISEAYTDVYLKRMVRGIRRRNHWLWRQGERIYGDPEVEATLPPRLLHTAGVFASRFHLDYGAIDILESPDAEFHIVDVNKTPHWGDVQEPGLIEHLRLGFSRALEELL